MGIVAVKTYLNTFMTVLVSSVVACVYAEVTLRLRDAAVVYGQPFALVCYTTVDASPQFASFYRSMSANNIGIPVAVIVYKGPSSCQPSLSSVSNYTYSCNNNGKEITLTVPADNLNEHDTVWRCINPEGLVAANNNAVSIFVNVAVSQVQLSPSATLTLRELESRPLTCTTSFCRPKAVISWWKNDVNITNMANSSMYDRNTTTGILVYIGNRLDNGHIIVCKAWNGYGNQQTSQQIVLDIRYEPAAPPIIRNYSNGSVLNIIENTLQVLDCMVTGGNPLAYLFWDCFGLASSIKTVNQTVTSTITLTVNRSQDYQQCLCVSTQEVQGNKITFLHVNVLYAPDVLVDYSGPSLANSTVLLTCTASAEPSQYTFHEWVHKVGETEIRRLNGENNANTSMLTLPNISIEDTGTYVCTVDNAITGRNGQIKQTGHTDISVRGTPFIENKNNMFIGMINKSARIEIPFYSNPSSTTVKFYRGENAVAITNTADSLTAVSSFLNTFTFYGKEVLLNGQIAILQFRTVKTTDYGEYTAVLLNDIGSTSRSIVFSSGKPETPANFHVTDVQEKQVTIQWLSGDHRGFDQTFVVQISMDNITWTNASLINAGKKEGWFSATITGLKSNTVHYFRLYSFNVNGGGNFADINYATRTLKESSSSLDTGASLGIGFGGIFLGVVGTISVIIIRKRITATPKYNSTREADMTTEMQNYANTRVSSSPVPSHYEELQQDSLDKTMYDHI